MSKRIYLIWALIALSLGVTIANDTIPAPLHEQTIDEVIVTGARYTTTAHAVPMTVSVVGREQLTDAEQLSVLPTLMLQVPGLTLTERGMMGYGVSGGAAGGINLRGASSGTGQVLVLIDGQPQYQGVFGHSISDSYQTMMAERVEVIRGPASMLYGSNALGGVINIITREAEEGVHSHIHLGAGMYNTFQGQADLRVRHKGFAMTAAGQYSRSDNHRERMDFQQYGGLLKLSYRCDDHWSLAATADLTHFDASHPGSVSAPLYEARQHITRGMASLALTNSYEHATGRVSVYDNFGRHTINDGYAPEAKPQTELFRSEDHLVGVSAYETLSLFPGSHITLGLDYQFIYGHAWYTSRETGEVVTTGKRGMQSTNSRVNELAGYVNIRQDFTDWIALDAGLRYDYHWVAGGQWIPAVGLVTRPVLNAELKATASRGFRNPTVKDLYLYAVANHDSLRAESVWNYELSWHQSFRQVQYGANLYFLHGDNMIQTVAGRNCNTGRVQNLGVEAEATWQITPNWLLTTNHSYIHLWHPVIGTPQYKGYLGAEMRYDHWQLQVGLQQLVGLITGIEKGEVSSRSSATLLAATLTYRPLRQLAVWVRGNNLLAARYELVAGYPMPRATVMAGVNISLGK